MPDSEARARELLAAVEPAAYATDPRPVAEPAGWRLLTVEDLASLPAPSFLVEDIVRAGVLNVLYGPSGIGKSFLALDWALCVATESKWWGKTARPGMVLYIAAEGVAGLHRRVTAWQAARRVGTVDRIRFLPDAVNLLDAAHVERAEHAIEAMPEPPALIVVDTMARCMVGGDENSARDVGMFIAGVDRLCRPHRAAALIVHHTGKAGEDERGSSALRGAVDMMLALKADASSARLECAKAKDSEPFESWTMHLSPEAESCVFRVGSNQGVLSGHEADVLRCLPESFGSSPVSSTKLLKASGVPERSYYRALHSLEERGFVACEQSGRSKLYSITDAGQKELLPTPANACQTPAMITAAMPPPLGVAGGSHGGSNHDSETPR